MAAKRKSAAAPRAMDTKVPEPPAPAVEHYGWGHDWRNPAVVFALDDNCPNAELARLAQRRR